MKTCPYCAEEIKQDAVVCRYCGRPYLIGAKSLFYMGRVYVIGKTDSTYAIWNMVCGGQPVAQEEPTDRGWQKAWQSYANAETGEKGRASGRATFIGVGGFIPLGH